MEVKDLAVSYGSKAAVQGVTFSLERGQVLSIVGESGSGKTTVIRAIMGCLPSSGQISGGSMFLGGQDLKKCTAGQWRALRGREIALIFQDSLGAINPIRTVGQQFRDYIRAHDRGLSAGEADDLAKAMLERVNLPAPEQILKLYPFELSGGMGQRVGIAMAMTFQPKVLLADEPTSALDVTTQVQIVEQIMDLCRQYNTAVVMVTHNLAVASYMSDQIMVMRQGQMVERGARDQVIEAPSHEYTRELLQAVPQLGGQSWL